MRFTLRDTDADFHPILYDTTLSINREDGAEEGEELQCEEVDMNDRMMDPLEWSVRKTIPIPKKYYWETGNYDVSAKTKAWHRTVQSLGIAVRGAEKVGGFFVSLLGLNNSRFDDVTAYMTDEEWEIAKENARKDKERRQAYLREKEKQKSKLNVV